MVLTRTALTGWAADPDTPSRKLRVDVYVDGSWGAGTFLAARHTEEPDAYANSPGYYGNHGFFYYVPPEYRGRQICVHAIDASAYGPNPVIGCTYWF
jgi:hypothetical protein